MGEKVILCDTNILINLFRYNDEKIKQTLIGHIPIISVVSKLELLQGVNSKEDFQKISKALKSFSVIPINNEISGIAESIFEKYLLSHHPSIPDTLIGATSIYYGVPLYTANVKHFKFITGLELV